MKRGILGLFPPGGRERFEFCRTGFEAADFARRQMTFGNILLRFGGRAENFAAGCDDVPSRGYHEIFFESGFEKQFFRFIFIRMR